MVNIFNNASDVQFSFTNVKISCDIYSLWFKDHLNECLQFDLLFWIDTFYPIAKLNILLKKSLMLGH